MGGTVTVICAGGAVELTVGSAPKALNNRPAATSKAMNMGLSLMFAPFGVLSLT
jgi:hypothetical protein